MGAATEELVRNAIVALIQQDMARAMLHDVLEAFIHRDLERVEREETPIALSSDTVSALRTAA